MVLMVSRLEVADGAHCAGLDSLQLPLSVDKAQPLSERHCYVQHKKVCITYCLYSISCLADEITLVRLLGHVERTL